MRIINLTPHDVTVFAEDGHSVLAVFPASGAVARVKTATFRMGTVDGIVPLTRSEFGEVEGLPFPDWSNGETRYIVSALVLTAVQSSGKRPSSDLLVPDLQVRDTMGRVIGCQALRIG